MADFGKTGRLGEVLIRRGLLTPAQLERALAQQRESGEILGAIVLKLGFVRPEALLDALSEHFGIPREMVDVSRVDWTFVDRLPASVFAGGNCFPLREDEFSVTVAIINPLDVWALSAAERAAGSRRVRPVLVLEQELSMLLAERTRRALSHLEPPPPDASA